jgi:hypothetical protein
LNGWNVGGNKDGGKGNGRKGVGVSCGGKAATVGYSCPLVGKVSPGNCHGNGSGCVLDAMDGPAVVPGIAKLFAGNVCFNNVAGFEQLNLASVTNVGAAKHINVSKLYN